MYLRNLWPVLLLVLGAAALLIPGCDKLITENNTYVRYDSTTGAYCLTCHGDSVADSIINLPTGQWANSAHASPALIERNVTINGTLYLTSNCGPICHTSQGFIRYTSSGYGASQPAEPTVIGCITCHLPHTGPYGSWNADTLRGVALAVRLVNDSSYAEGRSNQCVVCHRADQAPPPSTGNINITLDSRFGPHFSGQAEILSGKGGIRFDTVTVTPSHDSLKSKDGCLSCHYGTYINGRLAGNGIGYQFGEHTFRLQDTLTGEQFTGNCNVTGCHTGNPPQVGANGFYTDTNIVAIAKLGDSLQALLKSAGVLKPQDSAGLEFAVQSTIQGDAARILYNYLLYRMDGSQGIHNPKFVKQLLKESIARWSTIPRGYFAVTLPAGNCVPDTVIFTDSAFGAVDSVRWRFGDGDSATVADRFLSQQHVYLTPDSFTVSLTAFGEGGSNTYSQPYLIKTDSTPRALFSLAPSTGTTTIPIQFTDQSVRATGWSWDFGDGVGTSTEQNPTYTYSAAGTYTVKLIVTGHCNGTDSTTHSVLIATGL